ISRFADQFIERLFEFFRGLSLAFVFDMPGPIRIVKVQERSLGEGVRCSVTGGMHWIAFNLRRPTVMSRGHDRDIPIPRRTRGRIKQRLARNGPFHSTSERDQMLLWTAASREGQ